MTCENPHGALLIHADFFDGLKKFALLKACTISSRGACLNLAAQFPGAAFTLEPMGDDQWRVVVCAEPEFGADLLGQPSLVIGEIPAVVQGAGEARSGSLPC